MTDERQANAPLHDVVELLNVTGEDLTALLNARAASGWSLDRIDYLREPGVRRPQMAFVFFTRAAGAGDA